MLFAFKQVNLSNADIGTHSMPKNNFKKVSHIPKFGDAATSPARDETYLQISKYVTLLSLEKAYFSFFVLSLVFDFVINNETLETSNIITRLVACTQE